MRHRGVEISTEQDFRPLGSATGNIYSLYIVIHVYEDTQWYSSELVWEANGERRILNLKGKGGEELNFRKCTAKGIYTFYTETRTYRPNTLIDGSFLEDNVKLFVTNGTKKYPVKIVPKNWFTVKKRRILFGLWPKDA